jgi:hypothetical protein
MPVLPTFPHSITVKHIDADDLRVVWLEEAIDGFGDNPDYFEIAEISWDEARAAIGAERELVALASAAALDAGGFDSVADQLVRDRYTGDWDDDGPIDEGPLTRLDELDLGVMSAVAALVAGGALTTTSCRGHHSSRGEPWTVIRFICDDLRLPLITEAARNANCGLMVDAEGMLVLHASDVEAFLRFAEQMVSRAESFGTLSMDDLFESMDVYDGYLDEVEADNESSYVNRRDLAAMRRRMAADRPIEGQLSIFGNE